MRKKDKEITKYDLFGSIPKVLNFDNPFDSIDIKKITKKKKEPEHVANSTITPEHSTLSEQHDTITPEHVANSTITPEHSTLSEQHSTSLYSSSSLKNTTTISSKSITRLLRSTSPNLAYWRQKGLTEKQLAHWIKITECDKATMLRYLSYCHFDMIDLDLEKSKPIDNVLNWFYRMLEKTGGYPKPKGYKSVEQKQLEAERVEVEAKEKLAKEQQELYRRKAEAEQKEQFWAMMNNPEGELYKTCFAKLPKLAQNRKGTKMFEASMRGIFDKIMENPDQTIA